MYCRILVSSFVLLAFGFFFAARAATFTVSKTADTNDGVCNADCSLREAIIAANANGTGADTINFGISGGAAGVKLISVNSSLPDIATTLTIDGTTQSGYAGAPLIELNGANASNGKGFSIDSHYIPDPVSLTVKAIAINNFSFYGIEADCATCNVAVYGCYIGTNAAGTIAAKNGTGISLTVAATSIINIGGTGANEGNVISGNGSEFLGGSGIRIYTSSSGFSAGTPQVNIRGNRIGINASGTADLGNYEDGIRIAPGDDNTTAEINIGGSSTASRNVISGNDGNGVNIFGDEAKVEIYNNYIGTNAAGTADLGNSLDGINLGGQSDVTIGGTIVFGGVSSSIGNVISGNNRHGINIDAGWLADIFIKRNRIGTNAAGTGALGNSQNGIFANKIGAVLKAFIIGSETNSDDGNLISGNLGDGIRLDATISGIGIYGNSIGTDANQTVAVPNGSDGIEIAGAANLIGKANNAAARNIVSGNAQNGIRLTGAASIGNKIENNSIGADASGNALGNGANGVLVVSNASGNFIGGAAINAGNVVAFNVLDGVAVSSGVNNAIEQNAIYSNGDLGIDLGASGVTANDALDADTGANNLQNFPVLTSASTAQFKGFLNTTPNSNVNVQIYRADSCDASGNGEGRYFLGTLPLTTDNNGDVNFTVTTIPLTVGQIITATATDASGSTSEFSACRTVTPPPGNFSLTAAVYSVNESNSTMTIGVIRSGGSFGAVSVDYATANGTAIAGQDYAATAGTLNFADGQTSKTFDVPIINDALDEPIESLTIALSNPSSGANLGVPSSAILNIADNDNPPTISITDVSLAEGNQGATNFVFSVNLSAPSGFDISVNYATANGTANAPVDYISTNGTLNFSAAAGDVSKTINVAVNSDFVPELNETFLVNLTNAVNASIADSQGVGTIQDDDNAGKIQFAFAAYSTTESTPSATITVVRTNGAAGAVSIDYATSNGTATAGQDYTSAAGTLVFLDGETSKTFDVLILPDALGEANETIFLTLSNPNGGANLGNQTNAALTILDDDGGLPANVSLGGKIQTSGGTALANVLVTLAGSQNATAVSDQSGRFTFANLPSGGNFLITPTLSGYNFEPGNQSFSNLAGDVQNANFTGLSGQTPRTIRVASSSVMPGQAVVVPIELVSLGNENSAGFSLNYDAALLSSPQVVTTSDTASASLFVNNSPVGKLGVAVVLPAGQSFAAGTRQLVKITFNTAPTNLYISPITFGDIPIVRSVADANANALSAAWETGAVNFAQGYEADVAPRPTGSGNGSVTIADFTQVGKFVAGIDQVNPSYNEYQRADCAPRGTKGDGQLTISDFTQAGRYAAAIDLVQTSGGAVAPINLAKSVFAGAENENKENVAVAAATIVRVVNNQASPASQVLVSIEADTQGSENGFGFTLNYDQTKLSSPLVALGTGVPPNATLIPNTLQAGKVGAALALPFGQGLTAGTKQLVTIRFNVAANALSGQTPLTFGDAPVFREVSDVDAIVLPSNFQDGAINILGPTAAAVSIGGRVMLATGKGISRAIITMTAANGEIRTASTDQFGFYRFANVPAGETYIFAAAHKYYRFNPQIITVLEDASRVEFTADQ
jgi:CSLREA domain-containing protein